MKVDLTKYVTISIQKDIELIVLNLSVMLKQDGHKEFFEEIKGLNSAIRNNKLDSLSTEVKDLLSQDEWDLLSSKKYSIYINVTAPSDKQTNLDRAIYRTMLDLRDKYFKGKGPMRLSTLHEKAFNEPEVFLQTLRENISKIAANADQVILVKDNSLFAHIQNDFILQDYLQKNDISLSELTPETLKAAKKATGDDVSLKWCKEEIALYKQYLADKK
jgi:hypothetical protein